MKKSFLTFLILLLSYSSFSQNSFGARAGLNVAKISNTNSTTKTDFYAGILLSIPLSELFTLQPELTYSRQGGSVEQVYGDYYTNEGEYVINSSNTDTPLNYLGVGAMAKFFIMKDEKLNLLVGPTIDFQLNNEKNINFNSEPSITKFDFSLSAGIAYQFGFGLTLEGRYKLGVVDLNERSQYDPEIGDFVQRRESNSVIQIGVAYKFDFSKSK